MKILFFYSCGLILTELWCNKIMIFIYCHRFKEMQAKLGLGGDSKKSEKKEKAPAPKKEAKEEVVAAAPKPKDPLTALPAG